MPISFREYPWYLQALVFFVLLGGVEQVAIDGEQSTQGTVVCLNNFLDLLLPEFLFFEAVHPVAVILTLRL